VLKPIAGDPLVLPLVPGVPLGLDERTAFTTSTIVLDEAALLVLYTDGLTEVDRDPVRGEAALVRLLQDDEVLYAASPARYVSRLSARATRDDTAILAVRFGAHGRRWSFDVKDSDAAYAVKREFAAAVREYDETADTHDAQVILGELIANALRYTPGRVSIALSSDADGLCLHLMDEGRGFDLVPSLPKSPWSESGRGLFLVSQLAKSVTVRRLPAYGTYVKVLLPTSEGSEEASA
jgi:anti-sigma regulatory factor (Ser/Thr protein kinase)